MTPTLRRVTVEAADGLRLSVRVGGRGPAVLLIHGFTGSAEAWGDDLLSELARRWRVIVPDLVGHGASPAPADPDRYAMIRVLDDLRRIQEDLAGAGPASWVGYSMGGRVALAGAVERVAPLDRLVLESASPGLADADDRARRRDADERWARKLEEEGMEPFVEAWLARPVFSSQGALPVEVRNRERARRTAQDPVALAACLRGLGTGRQPSYWERLGEVRAPSLLLTGGLDPKFCALADAMAEELVHPVRRTVAGAGHAVHLEAPEAWLEAVMGALP